MYGKSRGSDRDEFENDVYGLFRTTTQCVSSALYIGLFNHISLPQFAPWTVHLHDCTVPAKYKRYHPSGGKSPILVAIFRSALGHVLHFFPEAMDGATEFTPFFLHGSMPATYSTLDCTDTYW